MFKFEPLGDLGVEQKKPDELAKLFLPSLETPGVPTQAMSKAAPGAQLGAAGIVSGVNLLGGLLQNAADAQAMERKLRVESAGKQTESQVESLVGAQKAQNDALTRLMANYRSALV